MVDDKQKCLILFAEDDDDDFFFIKRASESVDHSFRFVRASDGQELLDYLDEKMFDGDVPEIIILDLNMPKVNGIEVLKQMKENDQTKNLTTVVLTTSSSQNDREACLKLGADGFYQKPFLIDDYRDILEEILGEHC